MARRHPLLPLGARKWQRYLGQSRLGSEPFLRLALLLRSSVTHALIAKTSRETFCLKRRAGKSQRASSRFGSEKVADQLATLKVNG